MNEEQMFSANSPSGNLQIQLMLVYNEHFDELEKAFSYGMYLYPETLNLIILLYTASSSHHITSILHSVQDGKFCSQAMATWLQGYYGDDWKDKVIEYGFMAVAEMSFTPEDCVHYKLFDLVRKGCFTDSYDKFLKALFDGWGIEEIKSFYLEQKATDPQPYDDNKWYVWKATRRLLAKQKEFDFLAANEEWEYFDDAWALRYLAERKDYSHLILQLDRHATDPNWEGNAEFCCSALDKAKEDDLLTAEEQKSYKELKRKCKKS